MANVSEAAIPAIPSKMKKQRLQNADIFAMMTMAFFVITFVLKALTDGIFVTQGMKGAITDSKYLTMGGTIFFGLIYMVRHKKNRVFWNEFRKLITVALVFLVATLALIIYQNKYAQWQIRDILNLITPMIFAYVVLNVLSFEQLFKGLKIALVISVIGYIIQLMLRGVTFDDIFQSSFSDSTSPFESNDFSAIAIMFCFFFCYYRSSKWMTALATVYAIATFKRMAIIFAVIAFFFPIMVDRDKKMPKWTTPIVIGVFFGVAMFYCYLMLPTSASLQGSLHLNIGKMTMGRSDFLAALLNRGFQSFGFGSVEASLGHSLEMAFVRMTFELSPIAVLLFINNYWNITGRNLYCSLLMVFNFLNLTTADSISAMFAWAVCYILIGMVVYAHGPAVTAAKQSRLFAKWQRG